MDYKSEKTPASTKVAPGGTASRPKESRDRHMHPGLLIERMQNTLGNRGVAQLIQKRKKGGWSSLDGADSTQAHPSVSPWLYGVNHSALWQNSAQHDLQSIRNTPVVQLFKIKEFKSSKTQNEKVNELADRLKVEYPGRTADVDSAINMNKGPKDEFENFDHFAACVKYDLMTSSFTPGLYSLQQYHMTESGMHAQREDLEKHQKPRLVANGDRLKIYRTMDYDEWVGIKKAGVDIKSKGMGRHLGDFKQAVRYLYRNSGGSGNPKVLVEFPIREDMIGTFFGDRTLQIPEEALLFHDIYRKSYSEDTRKSSGKKGGGKRGPSPKKKTTNTASTTQSVVRPDWQSSGKKGGGEGLVSNMVSLKQESGEWGYSFTIGSGLGPKRFMSCVDLAAMGVVGYNNGSGGVMIGLNRDFVMPSAKGEAPEKQPEQSSIPPAKEPTIHDIIDECVNSCKGEEGGDVDSIDKLKEHFRQLIKGIGISNFLSLISSSNVKELPDESLGDWTGSHFGNEDARKAIREVLEEAKGNVNTLDVTSSGVNHRYEYEDHDISMILDDMVRHLPGNGANIATLAPVDNVVGNQLPGLVCSYLKQSHSWNMPMQILLIPFNISFGHWIGISVIITNVASGPGGPVTTNAIINVMDPMMEVEAESDDEAIEHKQVGNLKKGIVSFYKHKDRPKGSTVNVKTRQSFHYLQSDMTSCGALTILNLLKSARTQTGSLGLPNDIRLDHDQTDQLRARHVAIASGLEVGKPVEKSFAYRQRNNINTTMGVLSDYLTDAPKDKEEKNAPSKAEARCIVEVMALINRMGTETKTLMMEDLSKYNGTSSSEIEMGELLNDWRKSFASVPTAKIAERACLKEIINLMTQGIETGLLEKNEFGDLDFRLDPSVVYYITQLLFDKNGAKKLAALEEIVRGK